MASVSKSANLRFIINNTDVIPPEAWQDIGFTAAFNEEGNVPSIAVDSLVFSSGEHGSVGGRDLINQHIANGLTGGVGIFEGLPFNIQSYNNESSSYILNGHLATYDDYEDFPEVGRCSVKVVQDESKENLEQLIAGKSYGFMLDKGAITEADYSDLDYDVVPVDQTIDIIITSIVTYLMIKEVAEAAEKLADDIATIAGYSTIPPKDRDWETGTTS